MKSMGVIKLMLIATFIVLSPVNILAGTAEKKVGILLVSFGSSESSAQAAYKNITRKVVRSFPDCPVRWAYTSSIIRKKMAKQGTNLASPEMALAEMIDEGFSHVAVQSLHIIRGAEFDDLLRTVEAFRMMKGFDRIILGNPLLTSQSDMERAVAAIIDEIPPERKAEDAVLLMGHGSRHPSNAFYAALMFQLQLKDPNIFIGTVDGYPDIGLIRKLLLEKNIKKAYLLPLMSVSGNHAKKDMAGNDDDSWKTILTKSGIQCIPVLKGLAEYDAFVDIWIDHLEKCMRHLY